MNARRITDLDMADLNVLISLCATRIHTVKRHLDAPSFADKSSLIKNHKQLQLTLSKLEKMKARTPKLNSMERK